MTQLWRAQVDQLLTDANVQILKKRKESEEYLVLVNLNLVLNREPMKRYLL
jgi:hypothetical protein